MAQVNFHPDTQLSKSLTLSYSEKNALGTQTASSSPTLADRAWQGKTQKTGKIPFSIHVKNWDVLLLFLAKIERKNLYIKLHLNILQSGGSFWIAYEKSPVFLENKLEQGS